MDIHWQKEKKNSTKQNNGSQREYQHEVGAGLVMETIITMKNGHSSLQHGGSKNHDRKMMFVQQLCVCLQTLDSVVNLELPLVLYRV